MCTLLTSLWHDVKMFLALLFKQHEYLSVDFPVKMKIEIEKHAQNDHFAGIVE